MAAGPQWLRLGKISVVGTQVLFPGPSLAPGCRERGGREGQSRTAFPGFYRLDNACDFYLFGFIVFYSVVALGEIGFSPGSRKDIPVLSCFSEVQGVQTGCSLKGLEFLALGS